MSITDYYFKFTKFSNYAPSLVSSLRDEMSCFLIGVSDDLVEECSSDMLHDNMNISCLIVYAQQVEKTSVRRKSREVKKAKSYKGCFSKGRLDISRQA